MSRMTILFFLTLMAAAAGDLYAKTTKLTTYYPSPYGEYKNLKATEDAQFATSSGSVSVGGADNHTNLAVDDTLSFAPLAGVPADSKPEGSLRYVADTTNNIHRFYYRNDSAWVSLGGSGGTCYVRYLGLDASGSIPDCSCPEGFTMTKGLGVWGYCCGDGEEPMKNGSACADRPPGVTDCRVRNPLNNNWLNMTATYYRAGRACLCCQS